MECFIVENGAERRAGLEDLLPIIGEHERLFQLILREAIGANIDLAAALAFLPAEMKEMVYRNVSTRIGSMLRDHESEANGYIKQYIALRKAELLEFIGKCVASEYSLYYVSFPKNFIWKNTEPKEEKAEKQSPLESFIKRIEGALDSGTLEMSYYTEKITQDDIQNAFQQYQNDLQKIRSLSIHEKDLPAAALLFETGKIEDLYISYGTPEEWPSFLEKCSNLKKLGLTNQTASEIPSWIRNAASLRSLSVSFSKYHSLPDWVGDLQSLTKLKLSYNKELKTLPDSMGNLKNLDDLCIDNSPIEKLPESMSNLKNLQKFVLNDSYIEKMPDRVGDLQSLTVLLLYGNKNLKTLPDSIGNLKNLVTFSIVNSSIEQLPDSMSNLKNLRNFVFGDSLIEKIPDWIGDLQSLTGLSLDSNKNLKTLPDSIGSLKNLVRFNIRNSPIEELPRTMVNCTALENVDIFGTKITAVPDFIKSVKYFNDNTVIEIIPGGPSISYRCFCNSYYKLVEAILAFSEKARREGLLALEEELEHLADGFVKMGIRLVVDGTDGEYIKNILQINAERERDFYRKKLMEVATEGILSVQAGVPKNKIICLLASLVNIENNPVDAARAQYCTDDTGALDHIDFSAAIQPEGEREERHFIKRAIQLSELARREGLLALEEHIDHEKIAVRDVFEYGLVLIIDGWDIDDIAKILDNLIAHETDPVQKNIAQAKKTAVEAISDGCNTRLLLMRLCAYFDEDIVGEIRKNYDD